jgi:hypothetical protein
MPEVRTLWRSRESRVVFQRNVRLEPVVLNNLRLRPKFQLIIIFFQN